VGLISGIEYALPTSQNNGRLAEVDDRGREHSDSGVAVLIVVPGKKVLTKGAGILNATEPISKFRTIFQSAELAFRIRIVIET
jgi:hypothetical protein